MDNWRVVEVVLISVLAGTLLPVLFQLRSTLRAAEKLLQGTTPRLEQTLTELGATIGRLNRLAAAVEEDGRAPLKAVFIAVEGLSKSVEELRGSVRTAASIGAAVGPAVAAAVKAFRGGSGPAEIPTNGASQEALPLKEAPDGR